MQVTSRATRFRHKFIQIIGKATHGKVRSCEKVLSMGLSRKVRHHEAGHGSPSEKGGDGGYPRKRSKRDAPIPTFLPVGEGPARLCSLRL